MKILKSLECDVCRERFANRKLIKEHIKEHGLKPSKSFNPELRTTLKDFYTKIWWEK